MRQVRIYHTKIFYSNAKISTKNLPKRNAHCRVDHWASTDVIGRDDAEEMASPGQPKALLSDPLPGREGKDNHDDTTNHLLEERSQVSPIANEASGKDGNDSRG